MGRLIDADVFVEDLDTEALNLAMDGLKGTPRPRQHLYEIIDRINEQPTAYDVDKVVEELKILKKESLVEYNMGEYNLDNNIGSQIAETYRQDMNEGRCFAFDEAIEIVKQGCVVSDDVCKWKYINDFELVSENHESKCIEGYDYKYCPYCGKKIKECRNNDD